jgi:hypothetical protein
MTTITSTLYYIASAPGPFPLEGDYEFTSENIFASDGFPEKLDDFQAVEDFMELSYAPNIKEDIVAFRIRKQVSTKTESSGLDVDGNIVETINAHVETTTYPLVIRDFDDYQAAVDSRTMDELQEELDSRQGMLRSGEATLLEFAKAETEYNKQNPDDQRYDENQVYDEFMKLTGEQDRYNFLMSVVLVDYKL